MMPCTLFTLDTIGMAGNLIAYWEDENPVVRGVDGFPAFAWQRYGIYRSVQSAASAWLEREESFEDDVIARLDGCDDDDEVISDDDEDDSECDPAFDASLDEGAISSFHCLDEHAAAPVASRRRAVVVEMPPRASSRVPPSTESVELSPSDDELLPTRIGVHRAGRIAAAR